MGDELPRIIQFIVELDKLKSVLRRTKPVGLERHENSAEHSWQVCLLAVLLARHAPEPVDVMRVVEMLLVHDIPEIDVGDQIVYRSPSEARAAAERQAARRIFGLLPEPQAGWCMSRWEEFEARESKEAVFAYAVDRLMPVLHNLSSKGRGWRENEVPLAKVLAVNAAIGQALPSVWEHIEGPIREFLETGETASAELKIPVSPDWPWPNSLDALAAAPCHHTLLMENERVRVLDTRIPPGETVPVHTHRWPMVLYVLGWGDFVRRGPDGDVLVDTRSAGAVPEPPVAMWSAPFPPHSLENVGTSVIRVINIELKDSSG